MQILLFYLFEPQTLQHIGLERHDCYISQIFLIFNSLITCPKLIQDIHYTIFVSYLLQPSYSQHGIYALNLIFIYYFFYIFGDKFVTMTYKIISLKYLNWINHPITFKNMRHDNGVLFSLHSKSFCSNIVTISISTQK